MKRLSDETLIAIAKECGFMVGEDDKGREVLQKPLVLFARLIEDAIGKGRTAPLPANQPSAA